MFFFCSLVGMLLISLVALFCRIFGYALRILLVVLFCLPYFLFCVSSMLFWCLRAAGLGGSVEGEKGDVLQRGKENFLGSSSL